MLQNLQKPGGRENRQYVLTNPLTHLHLLSSAGDIPRACSPLGALFPGRAPTRPSFRNGHSDAADEIKAERRISSCSDVPDDGEPSHGRCAQAVA